MEDEPIGGHTQRLAKFLDPNGSGEYLYELQVCNSEGVPIERTPLTEAEYALLSRSLNIRRSRN
jgi:hypothetical protein